MKFTKVARYTLTFENIDPDEALRLASGYFEAFTFTPGLTGAWKGQLENSARLEILCTPGNAIPSPGDKQFIEGTPGCEPLTAKERAIRVEMVERGNVLQLAAAIRDAFGQQCVLVDRGTSEIVFI